MKKFLIIIFLLIASPCFAATYYVASGGTDTNDGQTNCPGASCEAWANAPGMTSCTSNCSTSPANGDTIILKGGDTWDSDDFPINVPAELTYTVDETWYTGGSWSRPIFDGEDASEVTISLSNDDNVTIDSIEFKRGGANFSGTNTVIKVVSDSDNVVIKNIYAHDTYSKFFLYAETSDWNTGTTSVTIQDSNLVGDGYSDLSEDGLTYCEANADLVIKDNTIDQFGYVSQMKCQSIEVYGNTVTNMNLCREHSAGVEIMGNTNDNIVDHAYIYGNYFEGGGGTAFIEFAALNADNTFAQNLRVYNNVIIWYAHPSATCVPPDTFSRIITIVTGGQNIGIYNNTMLYEDSPHSGSDGIAPLRFNFNVPNINFRNNILISEDGACTGSNDGDGIWEVDGSTPTGSSTFSNNLYYCTSDTSCTGCMDEGNTFAWWNSNIISETDSSATDNPDLTNTTWDNWDLTLTADSPAIDAGADLSSSPGWFTDDYNGNTRIGTWDIGAIEYGAGAPIRGLTPQGASMQ